MSKRVNIVKAALSSVLLLLVLSCLASAQSGNTEESSARIQFSETSFDFGSMYQNEEVTHLFTFRNVGNSVLKIEKVKSSCGCTAALPEKKELPPGGETTVKVTFRSGTMRDRVVKHVYVDSNDPVEPRVTLTIEGVVKVEVDLSPKGLYVSDLSVGETTERAVELTPVEVKSFKILSVTSDNPAVRVTEVQPLPDKRPGFKLIVRLGPLDKPGRINAKVTVKTDLPHTKEILVPVYGKVVSQEDAVSTHQ
jgi:hypothetical protein